MVWCLHQQPIVDGSTVLRVSTDDLGNTGGGNRTDVDSIIINYSSVNDAPVATGNTVVTNEDTPLAIDASDFAFNDVEGTCVTVNVTITGLNLNGGTLTHTGGTVSVNQRIMTVTCGRVD